MSQQLRIAETADGPGDAPPLDARSPRTGGLTVRARRFRTGSADAEDIGLEVLAQDRSDDGELLWVDVSGDLSGGADELRRLDEALGLGGSLGPSALDGVGIRFGERSLSLGVIGVGDVSGDSPIERIPLRLVAARNLVVSLHGEPLPSLERPVRVVAPDPRFGRLDAGTFLGLLLDGMLDGYFREVERMEQAIDAMDLAALREQDEGALLERLVAVRSRVAVLRRSLAPQREVFAALARPVEPDATSPIGWPWPGLPDRLEHAIDAIEHAREQLLGSFDLVSTRTAQRTNDVMRVLTVISGLLLPSVVIAGVMGMNFKEPFFDAPSNFVLVVAGMALLAIVILVIARVRHWI